MEMAVVTLEPPEPESAPVVTGSQLGLLGHLGKGTVARHGTVVRQPSRVCWLGISYLGVK